MSNGNSRRKGNTRSKYRRKGPPPKIDKPTKAEMKDNYGLATSGQLLPEELADDISDELVPPHEHPEVPANVGDHNLDAEPKKFRLDRKDIYALNLYLAGAGVQAAAKHAGLSPRTLHRLLRNPIVQRYIVEYYKEARQWVHGTVLRAVEVVGQELNNSDPNVRLRSAETVLKHFGKATGLSEDITAGSEEQKAKRHSASELANQVVQQFNQQFNVYIQERDKDGSVPASIDISESD